MNKQSVQLPGAQGDWGSYISKYQPDSSKVLDNMFTANSKNFVTDQTGMIDKRQGGVTWNRTSFAQPAADTYEAIFDSGARHFLRIGGGVLSASTGTGLFDVITSGYSSIGNFEWVTYQNRSYGCNGINNPQVYDIATSYGGVSYSFTTAKTKDMGAQAPVSAPTVGTPTAGGAVPVGSHRYQITFEYYSEEESNGSPISATQTATGTTANDTTQSIAFTVSSVIDGTHLQISSTTGMLVGDTIVQGAHSTTITAITDATHITVVTTSGWVSGNNTIALSNIPIGGYGVTARNIYRDNNADGNFLLIDTINDNTTTTYTDVIAQGSTPTPIPTFNNVPPVFSKCALWLDSIFIAPTGESNTIRYSNTGAPDVFDPSNFIVCQSDDVVTALYVYNGKLYVFGLHSVGTIEGNTPDTFYYHNLNNKVGCVDNRSIQVRSIVSVPTLWWLSDKGMYFSNGYTVEYGSDFIQDLVNLNLAQVNYATSKNTQSSFADFSGDTYTPSIDITSQPGYVTTIDPIQTYNQTSDWLGGSVVSNVKTSDSNFAEVPTQFAPTLAAGTLGGAATISGTNITLPSGGNFTGESVSSTGVQNYYGSTVATTFSNQWLAQSFTPTLTGTLGTVSGITVHTYDDQNENGTLSVSIYSDLGGLPGSALSTQNFTVFTGNGADHSISVPTATFNIGLTGGTRYWIVLHIAPTLGGANPLFCAVSVGGFSWTSSIPLQWQKFENGIWSNFNPNGGTYQLAATYTYSITPVGQVGTWTSPIYDSGSLSAIAASVTESGTYPSGASGTITVAMSPNADMSGSTSTTISNPNGSNSLSLSGNRYWQMTVNIITTDDRSVPVMGTPVLFFNVTATWVSQPINATTDNTGWASLTYTGNVPSGTSVTLTIATSSDNITYSSFGPVGSAATTKWAKVKFVLTTDSGNTVSPSISSVSLTWAVTGTITSSIIDTGTTPAGFGVFQWTNINPGVGTVTFYVRTASTSGGITSATFVAVTNGTFPAVSAYEFVQWKAVLTSTADSAPVITDVTVNWYTGSGATGVRCSSLFYNKTYYLSVATVGSTANNVLIQLDQFGKWRIQKDNSVGTLLLYFNALYFTDGINGNIYNGFIAATDNGTAITMDVRTKAWTAPSDLFLHLPRALKVTGLNTQTTIHAYYSVDRGNTWIELLNEEGTTGYTTASDGNEFVTLFVPNGDTLVSGRTIMFRIVSSDAYPCSIINFVPSFYTRRGRYLNG